MQYSMLLEELKKLTPAQLRKDITVSNEWESELYKVFKIRMSVETDIVDRDTLIISF